MSCVMLHQLLWQHFLRVKMYKYQLWIRVNQYQTLYAYVWADDDYSAKLLGEAQYGYGNVLNYTRLYE